MNKLLNYKTETFSFRVYTGTEKEKRMLIEFQNDQLTLQFLPEFQNYIQETNTALKNNEEPLRLTNIIYFGETPIGISTFYSLETELVFSHAIAPSARGNGYSGKMKMETFAYVFEHLPQVEKITTYIEKTNTNNIQSIKKITKDTIQEIVDKQEQKTYLKITNYNPNYKIEQAKAI